MRAIVLLVLLSGLGGATAAAGEPDFAALAETPRWRALMHINPGATLRDVGASYVDDEAFFLAGDGKRNPEAELRASWRALREPAAEARCRFPARYRFLDERFGWNEDAPLAHCGEYQQWRDDMPIGQLVLVFPAAYLNSPSSMFGHTLLRLDERPDPDAVWLSRSINFGAQVDAEENSILYIWRGLAGGYPGQFSVVSYVDKIRDYAFIENRDMWEYALDLKHDELDWLVRHLWELRDINFDYFFFDENCSFRLLELIKVARPSAPLLEGYRFAELPLNTVRTLYAADLVIERRYRPSKLTQLRHSADRLDADELAFAEALVRDPSVADSSRFRSYPGERRHLMALTAYRAVRVRHRDQERTRQAAGDSLALLRVVQRNPAPPEEPVPAPPPPESGHRTQMASLAAGRRGGSDYLEAGYRLTYHDLLDPITGFLPGAGIEGLDLRVRLDESEGLILERLDLVNIRSLAPRGTFEKPVSWFVHGGMERIVEGDARRTGLFLEGGPGASWRFGGLMPYTFLVGRAETVSGREPAVTLAGGAEIGAVHYADGVQLGVDLQALALDDGTGRYRARLSAGVPFARNQALRGWCAHEAWQGREDNACQLGWRHYFD